MKRRTAIQLLTQAMAAAGIASSLPAQLLASNTGPKKILFMGGTGFIGPHMVRALVAEGHDVWLFNRGKSIPHLFKDLNRD